MQFEGSEHKKDRRDFLYDRHKLKNLKLQYLTILQNNHIKQPIRVKRREARIFFIPLR